MRRPLAALLLIFAACGPLRLSDVRSEWSAPERIDAGRIWIGLGGHASFRVENLSRAKLELALSTEEPLSVPPSLALSGGEGAEVEVSIAPEAPGAVDARVQLVAESGSREVIIHFDAQLPKECVPSNDCHASAFDPESGECAETVLDEGSACGQDATSCIAGGACHQGTCVGSPVTCDDGNACTTDACVPGQGCAHFDSSARCEDVDDPCLAGFCDPVHGCQTALAEDGTRCGASDCLTAHVCIAGACVERTVPEGAACNEGSPCQQAGICSSGACVQPAATSLQPAWTYQSPYGEILAVGAMDPQEQLYWAECHTNSQVPACVLVSANRSGSIRYRAPLHFTLGLVRWMLYENGNIVLALDDAQIEIRRASDGALVATRELLGILEPLFSPVPNGTSVSTDVNVTALASDGAGSVYLTASAYSYSGDVVANRGDFVVALDDQGANVRFARRAAYADGLIVDELGRVIFKEISTEHSPGHLVALNASGTELWNVTPVEIPPVAVSGNRILQSDGQVRRASDGTDVAFLPSTGMWLQGVLLRGSSAWTLTSGDINPTVSVSRVETDTHVLRWSTTPDPLGGYAPTFLLEKNDAVLLAGRAATTGSTLWELDADGRVTFACQLGSGNAQLTSPWLGTGRLYAFSYEECPTCLRDNGSIIVAYDLPGRLPASSGWIEAKGSGARSNRPK